MADPHNHAPASVKVTWHKDSEASWTKIVFPHADQIPHSRLPANTNLTFELNQGEWSFVTLKSSAKGTPNVQVNTTSGIITVGKKKIDIGFDYSINNSHPTAADEILSAVFRAAKGGLTAREALQIENLRQHIVDYSKGGLDARERGLLSAEAHNIARPGRH